MVHSEGHAEEVESLKEYKDSIKKWTKMDFPRTTSATENSIRWIWMVENSSVGIQRALHNYGID